MSYPKPPESRSAIRKAGKRVAAGNHEQTDADLVDQWRSSHGYVLNTFQAWLKRHIAKQSYPIEFAQRLKRRRTVFDKLTRRKPDGSHLISDVTAMHDHAGCRLIFENLDNLNDFRKYMRSNGVTRNVRHKFRDEDEPDKYNYILAPKLTGYRGIHDVYRHLPRRHRRDETMNNPWDGLFVEVQYRTRTQHAWATAVEISDIIDKERTKFDIEVTDRGRFFVIASEIIARRFGEEGTSFQGIATPDLQKELDEIEDRIGILDRLAALKEFQAQRPLREHNVLSITYDSSGQAQLEIFPFTNAIKAIEKATSLESQTDNINAVYVRAENPSQLRSAYRNYFNDPVGFVDLLKYQ